MSPPSAPNALPERTLADNMKLDQLSKTYPSIEPAVLSAVFDICDQSLERSLFWSLELFPADVDYDHPLFGDQHGCQGFTVARSRKVKSREQHVSAQESVDNLDDLLDAFLDKVSVVLPSSTLAPTWREEAQVLAQQRNERFIAAASHFRARSLASSGLADLGQVTVSPLRMFFFLF